MKFVESLRLGFFSVLLMCLSAACTSRMFEGAAFRSSGQSEDQVEKRDEILSTQGCQRFEKWRAPSSQVKNNRSAAIVSLNDFHGQVSGKSKEGQSLISRLQRVLQSLCEKHHGNVFFVDAGDSFQGSYLSSMTQGRAVARFLELAGAHVGTFGNHEFDNGLEFLKNYLGFADNLFFVSSNVRSDLDSRSFPRELSDLPNLKFSAVFKLPDLRIGVVGVTTASTAEKILSSKGVAFVPFATEQDAGHSWIQTEAKKLRQQGADVVVLLAHAGGQCDMDAEPEKGDEACAKKGDELFSLLQSLPRGTLDAAVAGHSHQLQRHYINGVATIQTSGMGKSLGYLEVQAGQDKDQLQFKPRDPISLDADSPASSKFKFTVLAEPSEPSETPERVKAFEQEMEQLSLSGQSILREFPEELAHSRTQSSVSTACFAEAAMAGLRGKKQWSQDAAAIFALNAGALRTGVKSGALSREGLFSIAPYDNRIARVPLSASQMADFLAKASSQQDDVFTFVSAQGVVGPERLREISSPGSKDSVMYLSEFSLRLLSADQLFQSRVQILDLPLREAIEVGLGLLKHPKNLCRFRNDK